MTTACITGSVVLPSDLLSLQSSGRKKEAAKKIAFDGNDLSIDQEAFLSQHDVSISLIV